MPYDARGLMPLLATNPFAIWHYRTTDGRAAVLEPGYFSAATGQLQPGHLIILQAEDAMTLLPMREGGTVGDGLVLDKTPAPSAGGVDPPSLLAENGNMLRTENGDRLLF